eukprot:Sspe_Gene.117021::Locus_107315_Transcript_1_1_Confidence_1.000_Length_454::g.117021::m.117021
MVSFFPASVGEGAYYYSLPHTQVLFVLSLSHTHSVTVLFFHRSLSCQVNEKRKERRNPMSHPWPITLGETLWRLVSKAAAAKEKQNAKQHLQLYLVVLHTYEAKPQKPVG